MIRFFPAMGLPCPGSPIAHLEYTSLFLFYLAPAKPFIFHMLFSLLGRNRSQRNPTNRISATTVPRPNVPTVTQVPIWKMISAAT